MSFDLHPHDSFFENPSNVLDSPLCRNWTQGAQNGLACTYNTPLAAWSGGVLTPAVNDYLMNLADRWRQRIAGRNLVDPNISFLATNAAGMTLPDAQHFCVRPLVDAMEQFPSHPFGIECGQIALKILNAYFIQAKVPYFRDGGKGPFGYSGRSRIAGWGVAGLADAVRLFSLFDATKTQWDFLLGQVARYVSLIKDNYPLVDVPDGVDGDHLNVPHICVFNGGVLARGLMSLWDALVGDSPPPVSAPHEVGRLAGRVCEDMAQAFDPNRGGFWYDLPYGPDGKPLPAAEVAEIQAAAGKHLQQAPGETHAWCASPFTFYGDRAFGTNSAVATALAWQRQRAVEAGRDPNTHEPWFQKAHPVESIKFFEGWMPS